ncbi:MAG: zinc ribbon domain-containing protein [Promethearchaeota archaeon]
MPRGGGFSGGFRGGGSFGGGFRGSSSSFRSSFRSSSFSSSRPFGRTGARRTVTSSRSGPYSHRYYHPRRSYYYRPWYRRWWYSPWWGYYYRPWYYSPVYVGGGIIFLIIFLLILLPLLGVAFTFPGTSYDSNGVINYRSTETLYFNEYWYEYEHLEAGSTITFSIQSSPDVVSFAIADHPFDQFPLTTKIGAGNYSISLESNEFQYYSQFFRAGSEISYDFNSSGSVDFFITDLDNFNNWYYEQPTNFYYEYSGVGDSGVYLIDNTEDLYLVWYNDVNSTNTDVDISLSYEADGIPDFDSALYSEEAVNYIDQTTITVPNDGDWYFFVYFDPMNSPEESVEITFDVTYDTDKTSVNQWVDFRPTLIVFGVIVGLVIIFAALARRTQKQKKFKEGAKPGATKTETSTTKATVVKPTEYDKISRKTQGVEIKCVRCGATLKPGDLFCSECGGKVSGRRMNATSKSTPINSKICSYCGAKLEPIDNFCKYCGTRVDR